MSSWDFVVLQVSGVFWGSWSRVGSSRRLAESSQHPQVGLCLRYCPTYRSRMCDHFGSRKKSTPFSQSGRNQRSVSGEYRVCRPQDVRFNPTASSRVEGIPFP